MAYQSYNTTTSDTWNDYGQSATATTTNADFMGLTADTPTGGTGGALGSLGGALGGLSAYRPVSYVRQYELVVQRQQEVTAMQQQLGQMRDAAMERMRLMAAAPLRVERCIESDHIRISQGTHAVQISRETMEDSTPAQMLAQMEAAREALSQAQEEYSKQIAQHLYGTFRQAQATGQAIHKTWIQEGLRDRQAELYANNQYTINSVWQSIIAEELRQEKAEAEETAKAMLLDIIGEDEYKVYEETGQLLVHGRVHDYLINKQGGVKRVTKDKIIPLCVHLKERFKYPETDNIIALAMHFKHREFTANRTANSHRSQPKGQLPRAANF